jgi:hypothetical protein
MYIVIIRCNLDDVIVGCFDNVGDAIRRQKECEADPDIRYNYQHVQSVESGYIDTDIVFYRGTEASIVA